jgi:hypothetical protein
MTAPSFDATHAVRFDLSRGSVRAGGDDDYVLLVPSNALGRLMASAPQEAAEALARTMGTAIGRRARARLENVASASIEALVTQLAGQAALAGLGALAVERWGRALVVVIEGSPLASALLAPLVASALEATFERQVWCTLLSSEGNAARILVASERAIERVRDWMAGGVPWGDTLTRLQGAAS